jgi:2',3'-cyclic-nucleotide 2'-phosphodiesterase (5'-nucleotidase family)
MRNHCARDAALLAALVLVQLGSACAKKPVSLPTGTPLEQRFPACDPGATTQTISFVHINDMHSNYQLAADGVSPYARVKGYYKSVKAQNPYTLFTSAGDEYEKGAVAEQISKGMSTREVLFGMQFDIRVIGNHDFGWSEQEVLADSLDPYSVVLSASVHYAGPNPKAFGAVDYVEEKIGCVKIGFFGMTTWGYSDLDQALMGNYYPDMPTNLDFLGISAQMIAAHRADVDLLIAITHEGTSADGATALNMPGIDIILGGHSHTLIQSLDPAASGGTYIIQSGAYASDINRLDVTYDLKAKKISGTPVYTIIPVNDTSRGASPAPDPATQSLVEAALQKYAPDGQKPIASTSAAVTDTDMVATIAAKAGMQVFNADAAIIDVSTVWNPFPAGPISMQDCYNAFEVERGPPGTPGFNSLYTVNIDGGSLKTLASQSLQGWVVVAPQNIDTTKTYVLLGQKRTLNHPGMYLPTGVTISGTPTAGSEVWEALSTYATSRQKLCQYIDVDQTIPGCTPG